MTPMSLAQWNEMARWRGSKSLIPGWKRWQEERVAPVYEVTISRNLEVKGRKNIGLGRKKAGWLSFQDGRTKSRVKCGWRRDSEEEKDVGMGHRGQVE